MLLQHTKPIKVRVAIISLFHFEIAIFLLDISACCCVLRPSAFEPVRPVVEIWSWNQLDWDLKLVSCRGMIQLSWAKICASKRLKVMNFISGRWTFFHLEYQTTHLSKILIFQSFFLTLFKDSSSPHSPTNLTPVYAIPNDICRRFSYHVFLEQFISIKRFNQKVKITF